LLNALGQKVENRAIEILQGMNSFDIAAITVLLEGISKFKIVMKLG